jgi:hypothetical protein
VPAKAAVTYFFRTYVLLGAAPVTATVICGLGSAANNVQARYRTDGALELFVVGAAQGSPSAVFASDGIWHRVELKAVCDATNWTSAELQIDGISIGTWSGSQLATFAPFIGGLSSAGSTLTVNYDDIALNDSTGAANNTYPGDGAVVLLVPVTDASGGTGWTMGAGAAISGNSAAAALSQRPPAGVADNTSNPAQIRNATSNANVSVGENMTTYAAAGVPTGATIKAISPVIATAAPVVTSAKQGTFGVVSNPTIANIALGATGTAGAFWSGVAAGTYGTGWKWSFGTMTETPTVTLGTAPVMQVTQVTASTRIAIVCFMGMYVDYTPAAALPPERPQVIGQAVQRMAVR